LPGGRRAQTWPEAVRHTTALSTEPLDVHKRFSKAHQRSIRKAERSGLRIVRGCGAAELEAFYHLHLGTRKRQGVPIQPRRFFRLLQRHILGQDLGFVQTAWLDEKPIAAAVFLTWNDTLVYKFGASDDRHWEHRPNHLLFWTAIRWACENGYRTFDWGRTDLENEGLRQFKSAWGAREEPLIYSAFGAVPAKRGGGRLGKALGTMIRRSPTLVCQATGELMYRYAIS
jgi:lipid II:glycine glycyltransferase (peptidoglycan interpeptide bridge formation enzyme)